MTMTIEEVVDKYLKAIYNDKLYYIFMDYHNYDIDDILRDGGISLHKDRECHENNFFIAVAKILAIDYCIRKRHHLKGMVERYKVYKETGKVIDWKLIITNPHENCVIDGEDHDVILDYTKSLSPEKLEEHRAIRKCLQEGIYSYKNVFGRPWFDKEVRV